MGMFVNTYYGSFNVGTSHIIWALASHGYICTNIGKLAIIPPIYCAPKAEVLKMVFVC